jgi:hypothetical protein
MWRCDLTRWFSVTIRLHLLSCAIILHIAPLLWGSLEIEQYGRQGHRMSVRRWDWGPTMEMGD